MYVLLRKDKLINKYGLENVVVSLSSIKNNSIVLAIGSLMEKYSGKLSVVQYDHQKGIMSFDIAVSENSPLTLEFEEIHNKSCNDYGY